MENNISFDQVKKLSYDEIETVRNLAKQFGDNYMDLTDADVKEMLDSPNTFFLVAKDLSNQKIIGMVTVFIYRTPYNKKAYIDDFIIDETYRGRGIGTKLFKEAINVAKEKGAAHVDFTSNPKRVEANKFYEKLGFKKRETNVYRFSFN